MYKTWNEKKKKDFEVKPISFFILIYFKVTPKGYMAQKGMRRDSLSVWRSWLAVEMKSRVQSYDLMTEL